MDYEFHVDDALHIISLEKKEGRYVVSLDKKVLEADIQYLAKNVVSILIEDKSYLAYIAHRGQDRLVWIKGYSFDVKEPTDDHVGFPGSDQQSQEDMLLIRAPMPGKVIKINVAEKDKVRRNQTLAIVEAMKMENEIKSSLDGRVKQIFVSPGDLVDPEKPLIELESEEISADECS